MKKIFFAFLLMFSSMSIFAQSEILNIDKKLKLGFNAGVNWTNLYEGGFMEPTGSVSGAMGWRIGVLADYRLSNRLSFVPKTEVSFNSIQFVTLNPDNSVRTTQEVMPVSLEFMGHLQVSVGDKKSKPYLLIGPAVRVPISNQQTVLSTATDMAIDLGIGLDKVLPRLNIAPELRYSFGLRNIGQEASTPELNIHTISLVCSFKK